MGSNTCSWGFNFERKAPSLTLVLSFLTTLAHEKMARASSQDAPLVKYCLEGNLGWGRRVPGWTRLTCSSPGQLSTFKQKQVNFCLLSISREIEWKVCLYEGKKKITLEKLLKTETFKNRFNKPFKNRRETVSGWRRSDFMTRRSRSLPTRCQIIPVIKLAENCVTRDQVGQIFGISQQLGILIFSGSPLCWALFCGLQVMISSNIF